MKGDLKATVLNALNRLMPSVSGEIVVASCADTIIVLDDTRLRIKNLENEFICD